MSLIEFPGLSRDVPSWLPVSLGLQAKEETLSTGTTLVAMEFDGGVVLGADSRTSMGSYVSNRGTDKLTPVTDYVFACRSGSAADTQVRAAPKKGVVRSLHISWPTQGLGRKNGARICFF